MSEPFGSLYVSPDASTAVYGTAEETVTARRPSARRTRTSFRPAFPSCGAGVVVSEDLLVRAAGERLAVRAVLAHADAVSVAPSGDDEDRLAVGRRRRLLSAADAGCDEDDEDENGDEERAHEGSRVAP